MDPPRRLRSLLALPALLGAVLLTSPGATQASTSPGMFKRADGLVVGVAGHRGAANVPGRRIAPGLEVVGQGSGSAAELREEPGVRFVERNHTYRASALPNDKLFSRQWPLSRPDGIGAVGAWWTSLGATATIAVLDSGADMIHPDLAPNLWTNPSEVAANGVDDDLNGFVDDVHGADVIGLTGDPTDRLGHGTAMSGVAAARGGNGIGISGVAPSARIMVVKVLDDRGAGSTSTLVAGIRYATAQGADVINLSVNGPDPSIALDEAMAAAEAAGVVVVTSAGNDGANRDTVPSYPASSTAGGVIAVGASVEDHGLAHFSGWGAGTVDLAAPGETILTTARGGGYELNTGTSPAAAHVSGAVALLAAARPDATPAQLRAAVLGGTHPLRHDASMVAAGELDATRALRRLAPSSGPRVQLVTRRLVRSDRRAVTLHWRLRGAARAVASYRLTVGGRRFAMSSARTTAPARRRALRLEPGLYRWTVQAFDASGRRLASHTARLNVAGPQDKQGP